MLLAGMLALTGGCSLLFAHAKPHGTPARCAGYTPVVIDAAITAAWIALAVKSYAENQCDSPDGCHTYDPTGLFVLPAIPFGISAAVGASRQGSCRAQLGSTPSAASSASSSSLLQQEK